ncbi:MAG: hypothetical protein WBX81_01730 [Nitrososphaeraceae archaeon]
MVSGKLDICHPVPSDEEHNAMIAPCRVNGVSSSAVAINPKHSKLTTALHTAVENGEGSLDKQATSHVDLLDVF